MKSRERVERLLKHERPDRIAVLPQLGDHAGWVNGLTMDVIYHDAVKVADAHVKALRDYGYDVAAIQVEPSWPIAEACGCTVTYPLNKCPWITERIIKNPEDIDKVKVPDFMAHPATRTILEATTLLKDKVGSNAMIAGYIPGPLTFALQLVTYNDFIIRTRKDPAFVEALINRATLVVKGFAEALKGAGAEMLVICEHDLQMFSPEAGKKYIVPHLPDVCSVFDSNMLHSCGKVESHLSRLADDLCSVRNLRFITFSHEVSISKMIEVYGDRMGISGNIDHIHLLPSGTPETVQAACRSAIEEGMKAKVFMLAPGCEITIDTPVENIKAFVQSAALFGRYT
jgi:uroporphyrinogen decarboxylase